MNTLTRGEKIDMAIENAKRTAVKVLLVIWAVLTVFLGIGLVANKVAYDNLKTEYEKMESEYKDLNEHVEAIYVYRK